jgi:hypothetical protein
MFATLEPCKEAVSENADTWDGMERKKKIEILMRKLEELKKRTKNHFT